MGYWRRQCTQENIAGCVVTENQVWSVVNPLNPNISMYILHTVLYKFPKVLTRRICLSLFDNQELLKLVIIFFILLTLMYDSGVIL